MLQVMFEMAEVTLSRVYMSAVFGFCCIMVKVPSDANVSGFHWKSQHNKSEWLCKRKTKEEDLEFFNWKRT